MMRLEHHKRQDYGQDKVQSQHPTQRLHVALTLFTPSRISIKVQSLHVRSNDNNARDPDYRSQLVYPPRSDP